ncbi:hypothetical protein Tco_1172687 [Tanacetum coccineum]
MANLKFADTHNLVSFLSKPEESDVFEQIVDFLNANPVKHALTVNPTIYMSCIEQIWATIKVKTVNGEVQLHALVDGKKIIINESTVRRDLQLEDAEGIDCLSNSTIFEQLALMGAKTIAWNEFSSTMTSAIICLATNQKFNFSKYIFETMVKNLDNVSGNFLMYPSGPIDIVADEAVHKELGDSLVRAATTASSLEAKLDSGNITKTRSKATPNEADSQGTTSGGGPRHQETMGILLLKLGLRMVLDLEKTKTTQQNEIASLKRRVKKLEQKKRSRTHGLKRLHKVGMSRRVESSRDEDSLGEDASKQGRQINVINADKDITLVNVQDDAEMFDVNTLTGDEVFAEQEVAAKDVNLTIDEVTLAQALAALKSVKPKVKGVVIQEPSTTTTTISSQQPSQDKGKGIMVEEPVKTMKKKDLIRLDEETAKRLQAEFDEEERLAREKDEANVALIEEWDDIQAKIEADHELAQRLQAEEQEELFVEEKAKLFQQLLEYRRKHFAAKSAEEKRNKPPTQAQQRKKMFDRAFKRVNTFVDFRTDLLEGSSKRAGEELEQESTKKQKVDEDKHTIELQSLIEVIPDKEDVAIDVVPLATKPPTIVDWKIHKEGKKSYYQIVRVDGKSQMYKVFSLMLKSFSREDLEDLYKLVKAKYKSVRPVEDLDLVLWSDLKTMFKPHVEDEIWKLQQRKEISPYTTYNYGYAEQEASS